VDSAVGNGLRVRHTAASMVVVVLCGEQQEGNGEGKLRENVAALPVEAPCPF